MRKSPAKAKSEDSPAYISTPAHAALPSHADALRALDGMPTAWVVQYAIDRVQADIPTAGRGCRPGCCWRGVRRTEAQ